MQSGIRALSRGNPIIKVPHFNRGQTPCLSRAPYYARNKLVNRGNVGIVWQTGGICMDSGIDMLCLSMSSDAQSREVIDARLALVVCVQMLWPRVGDNSGHAVDEYCTSVGFISKSFLTSHRT